MQAIQIGEQHKMEILFSIAECSIYEINNEKLQIIIQSDLSLYQIQSPHLLLLKSAEWQYSLAKDTPVILQSSDSKKMYLFPKQNGHYGLVLGSSVSDEQEAILESILFQNSNFLISTPQQESSLIQQQNQDLSLISQEQNMNQPQSNEQQLQQQPELNKMESSTSKMIQDNLQKGGNLIRSGLIVGGGIIAEGIKIGGRYIKSNMSQPTYKEVKPETLAKLKMISTTSADILSYTSTQIQAFVDRSKSNPPNLGDNIAQSDHIKNIPSSQSNNNNNNNNEEEDKNLNDAKNIAKGSVNALASIYDGVFESLCIIGRSLQGVTTKVISAKYGDRAGVIAHESLETIANLGSIPLAIPKQAVKVIQERTDSSLIVQ